MYMNKNLKIGLIIGGSLALVGIGYLVWKKYSKKNTDSPRNPEEVKEQINNIEEQAISDDNVIENKLDKSEAYKTLKSEIEKSYTLYNNEDFVMCPTDTIKIANCKNNKPFSEGLTQGVWIQIIRRYKSIKKSFNDAEKDIQVKELGNKLLSKLKEDTDKIFLPKFYNTDTTWYAEYLKKGGTPIN